MARSPDGGKLMGSERWLSAVWPFVRAQLPRPPARVVEIGCGPLGGFIPMLRSSGYEAVGIDPQAPDAAHYERIEFERATLRRGVDAVVACTSLHHVADPDEVIDGIATTLASRGTLVVIEWDWETFDERTARWCFQRLDSGEQSSWLRCRRDEFAASALDWAAYLRDWAQREGLHSGDRLLRSVDRRFERMHLARGSYFFTDLVGTDEADEAAAIAAGEIQATRIDYAGRPRPPQ